MVARWSGWVSEAVVGVVWEVVSDLVKLQICGDFTPAGLIGTGESILLFSFLSLFSGVGIVFETVAGCT
jgi:hypothetical protein